MGRDIDEYLVYLKENAAEIRNLGKEWGMTEEEINSCVDEALSLTEDKEKLKKTPKNTGRHVWSYIRFAGRIFKKGFYAFLILSVLSVAGLVFTSLHEPSEKFVSGLLQPYGYQILRYIRFATLPLHNYANITKYYDAECMIDNPFYVEASLDCEVCQSFKKAKDVNASDFAPHRFSAYVHALKPIVFRKSLKWNVTYQDLRKLYLENRHDFDTGLYQFDSTNSSIECPRDLFREDKEDVLNMSETLRMDWQSRTVRPSAALRRLFPRPAYLPENAEIALEKHVLIDGPRTPTYQAPYIGNPTQLYTMGSGRRRVLLRPVGCNDVCNSMLIIMEAGDALMYHREMWRMYIATNGDQPSIGYLMPFNL